MKRHQQDLMGIYLLLVNAFIYFPAAAFSPFMSAFYSGHGINATQIGILYSIGPVAAICIQPLWAMLSDSTGKRKQIFGIITLGCTFTPLLYYSGSTFAVFFMATMAYNCFSTALVPLSDAIIIKITYRYQLDFARIRIGGTIGYALMVLFAGNYIKTNPNSQFAIGAVSFLLLFLISLTLPVEEKSRQEGKTEKKETEETVISKGIFKSREIIFVLAFALISQIGLSFHGAFMGVYVLQIGYSQETIGVLSCIAAFSEIPALFCINRLTRKYGSMKILMFSGIMVALRLLLITAGGMPVLVVAQVLQSVTYITIYYSCAVYINENVLPGKSSQGQSILAMLQAGAGSILGNIAGGFLVDRTGVIATYRILAVLILLAVAAVIFVYRYAAVKRLK